MQIVQKFLSFPCVLLTLGYSNHLLKFLNRLLYFFILCNYGFIFHLRIGCRA